MERLPTRLYSPEFHEQTVRLYEVGGLTMPEVSKQPITHWHIKVMGNESPDEGGLVEDA